MKEDLLKEFRNEYTMKLKMKQKNDKYLKTLMERKNILENSPLIKSYIELTEAINQLKNNTCSINDIFSSTLSEFESKGLTDETNEIYFYLGSFDIDEHGNEYQVDRNDDFIFPLFNCYMDIESKKVIEIPFDDADEFEYKNKVIITSSYPDALMITDIRNDYFCDALYEGQENACKKVLSRNKKNL